MTEEELSISDATLIARLREVWAHSLTLKAADRIEQLVATNEALRQAVQHANDHADAAIKDMEALVKERDEAEQREKITADAAVEYLTRAEHWENVAIARDAKLRKAEAQRDALKIHLENTQNDFTEQLGRAEKETLSRVDATVERDAAIALLRESRSDLEHYVTQEYPKHLHPYYERQWNRDMELCRRIDAHLGAKP